MIDSSPVSASRNAPDTRANAYDSRFGISISDAGLLLPDWQEFRQRRRGMVNGADEYIKVDPDGEAAKASTSG